MGLEDAIGLLEGADDASLPTRRAGGGEPPAKKPKNTNLKHWELPPGQLLNPMGMSGVGVAVKHFRSAWQRCLDGSTAACVLDSRSDAMPAKDSRARSGLSG